MQRCFEGLTIDTFVKIPDSAKIIFVSDFFVDDYQGGAELTTQALIDAAPFPVFKIHSREISLKLLEQGADRFWIFGNFVQLNPQLLPSIMVNLNYAVLEYDYKYCRVRSPEKHLRQFQQPCDCHEQLNGKLIASFFHHAKALFWMSEDQKKHYESLFPFLKQNDSIVLSSVFDKVTLNFIRLLRQQNKERTQKWIVLGSDSWIKGFDAAKEWCVQNNHDYQAVWNVPYNELLELLATSEGFVYLPLGKDTCPRMIIEAKLLGCKLMFNDNVQHANEDWFATDNLQDIENYLYAAPNIFWNAIKHVSEYSPKISGYTTTLNCVQQDYPFQQCITSMLQFCDEVCVVDGGSSDETWSVLSELAHKEPKLKIKQVIRDWNHPRFAVFDGMQKTEARKMCTGDFCWQMDSDEIVHEDDVEKIKKIVKSIAKSIDIIALPVIEYWGGCDKVRIDVLPWKWRLSRNLHHIIHGIPADLRRFDEYGNVYSAPGSDGCNMIHADTGERLEFVSFYEQNAAAARTAALAGNSQALNAYEKWFNEAVSQLPSVFHYSWYDLMRKIKLYKNYWTKHWENLQGNEYTDSAESNMMFDVPWSQVTDAMIESRAQELSQIGGWIWHRKWNGTKTPWISCNRSQPSIMKEKNEKSKH